MKNKTIKPEPVPELVHQGDGMFAAVRTQSGHHITISRRKSGGTLLKPRWSAKVKARISWSGGNGNQTIEETEEMYRWLRWATSVAKNMNVRNPDRALSSEILFGLHY